MKRISIESYTNGAVSLLTHLLQVALLGMMACTPDPCQKADDHEARDEQGKHDGPGEHDEHDNHRGHDEHDEHGNDLSRSVEDLFAARCEHNVKTHECDECRYEVGVVKVPQKILDMKLVTLHTIQKRTVSSALKITGEVQFDERRVTHVSTQVSGIVKKVHVTLGDKVVAGQALVELESVEVGNARAVFQEAAALKTLAQQNFDRAEALRKEGIASEKEVHQAKQELDAATIRVTAAGGTLKRIGTGKGGAGNNSGRLVLKAPAEGSVLAMHAVRGEVADTNESLFTIGDNRSLWVWADLYEKDYPRVLENHSRAPLKAAVYVKAFGEQGFAGVLDYISPAMSESSRTVRIRISMPNLDGKLLAGMFAEVDLFLPSETDEQVLSAPASAVLADGDQQFVFVHHNGEYYVRRPVTTGAQFGNWIEITSGMSGGEQVAAEGAFLLKSDVLRSKMGAGCAH